MSVDQIRHVFLVTDIELGACGTVMCACLTDAAMAARNFMVLHCGHEDKPCAPSECLADLVSERPGTPEQHVELDHCPFAHSTCSCVAVCNWRSKHFR
jgi:Fcf1